MGDGPYKVIPHPDGTYRIVGFNIVYRMLAFAEEDADMCNVAFVLGQKSKDAELQTLRAEVERLQHELNAGRIEHGDD